MDAQDELQAIQDRIAEVIKESGAEVIAVNGEPVTKPKRGFRKNNNGTEELGGDADAAAANALSGKMYKLRKKIPADLIEELEALDVDDLKKRIAQCECNILEVEQARDADEDLKALKLQLKEASEPYRDGIKAQRAIASYSACLLDQKGA